jgi:nicotinamide-nucleotide amidase
MPEIAEEIGQLLKEKGLTIGTVESATGGLIANLITNISGSSDYFKGSIVSYANEIKSDVVGVKKETLAEFGAVSAQTAQEMAAGGRKLLKVDICIADTGIAGPSGATPGKPVGLFFLGIAAPNGTFTRKHIFTGSRIENKQAAAMAALAWMKEYLLEVKVMNQIGTL